MAASIEDPRTYLAIRPVPAWEVASDAKLRARSLTHYHMGSPTRWDMFKMNYARRCRQLSAEGFRSAPWRPYQDVGHPLELDAKKLIQKALGQETAESQQQESPVEQQQEQISARSQTKTKRGGSSDTLKFRPKSTGYRIDRHLQNISENLTAVETTKSFVKRGHSLFQVLNSENPPAYERPRSAGPMKAVGFKEVVDGETDHKEALSCKSAEIHERPKGKAATNAKPPSPKRAFVSTAGDTTQSFTPLGAGISGDQSNETVDDKSKSYLLWRQLCALHWLIEACQHEIDIGRKLALCEKMIPLAECWNVAHPGGRKIRQDAGDQERYIGIKWRKFMKSNASHHASRSQPRKYSMVPRQMLRQPSVSSEISHTGTESYSRPPSARSQRSMSIRSLSPSSVMQSPSSATFKRARSQSRLSVGRLSVDQSMVSTEMEGVAGLTRGSLDGSSMRDHRVGGHDEDSDENPDYHVNLQKLLSTVRESVSREMLLRQQDADREASRLNRLRSPVYKWAFNLYIQSTKPAKSEGKAAEKEQPTPDDVQDSSRKKSAVKIRPHTAGPTVTRKRPSMQTDRPHGADDDSVFTPRNTKRHGRPKSSPPKLLSQTFCPAFQSESKAQAIVKIKEQFKEVTDLKALQLHQNLEEMDRSRVERMEKKFEAFGCRQYGMHRDLQDMRSVASLDGDSGGQTGKNKMASSANAAAMCEWYNILKERIGSLDPEDKLCNTVMKCIEESAARSVGWRASETPIRMKKLKQTALTSSGINTEAFLVVLRRLRPFEFCAPDVSAAIEFMRDYVVKIPPEQFEELRGQMV